MIRVDDIQSDAQTRPASGQRPVSFRWARVLLLLVLVLVLAAGGASCTRGLGSGSDGRPGLRVGVSPSYPPVIFENDGAVVGIEADLARIVGDAIGRRIEFEIYPFPELFGALERGEIDVIMSGVSVTPERSERASFTQPYMQVGQLALIRSRDIPRFGRIQTLRRSGARVGYQRDTTGERFVAAELTRSTSFAFPDVDSGIRSLRAGRIDFFVHDAPTVWLIAGDPSARDLQGLYQPLTEEHLAWAVRPDDIQLLALLDATLDHWKREGVIETIVDRWIPVRVTVR